MVYGLSEPFTREQQRGLFVRQHFVLLWITSYLTTATQMPYLHLLCPVSMSDGSNFVHRRFTCWTVQFMWRRMAWRDCHNPWTVYDGTREWEMSISRWHALVIFLEVLQKSTENQSHSKCCLGRDLFQVTSNFNDIYYFYSISCRLWATSFNIHSSSSLHCISLHVST